LSDFLSQKILLRTGAGYRHLQHDFSVYSLEPAAARP